MRAASVKAAVRTGGFGLITLLLGHCSRLKIIHEGISLSPRAAFQ